MTGVCVDSNQVLFWKPDDGGSDVVLCGSADGQVQLLPISAPAESDHDDDARSFRSLLSSR